MSASAAATVPLNVAPNVPQNEATKVAPVSNVTGWRRHYLLFVLLLVYGMSMIDRQIMGVLIEPIKKEMGVSDSAMGLLTGLAFALFYSILAVPFGRYADRTNRRNLIAWCCGGWSIATGLCGMAVGFWSLTAARVGVAVGEAGSTAASTTMIADVYPPEQRSRAMSVFSLGPHLGSLIGLGVGAWIAQHYGWRAAFLWLALPGVLIALVLRLTCREPLRGAQEALDKRVASHAAAEKFSDVMSALRRNKAFVGIGLAGMVMAFSGYAIGMWTTAFLVRSHGLQLKDAGAIMGFIGGPGAIFGALLSGWLTDVMAKRDVRWQIGIPLLATLISIPLGLAFYLNDSPEKWVVAGLQIPHAVFWYGLFAVFASFWAAPAFAALANVIASSSLATSLSIYNLLLTAVGGGLGPLTVGLLSDAFMTRAGNESLRWALVSMLAFYVLGALAYAWSIKPYAHQMAAKKIASSPY
ncbi:MFS transporter [Comamonas sp. Y33R10-2]|uniref:spinster family MFS transporter n=1 Tax=Comamonas sp. Y33R10-2 TaxID=2853257 RepID=UPI001C5C9DF5|nr:MFS transporter [Comamonas sp. Y33R10-2]QXZ08503.1 MFS transporter [Comamonas sp. Y33R10-2]